MKKLCYNFTWTLSEIKARIKDSGLKIKVLSNKYIDNHTPLQTQCLDCGNINNSSWGDIQKRIKKMEQGGRINFALSVLFKT